LQNLRPKQQLTNLDGSKLKFLSVETKLFPHSAPALLRITLATLQKSVSGRE